jgi:hypothetical protein
VPDSDFSASFLTEVGPRVSLRPVFTVEYGSLLLFYMCLLTVQLVVYRGRHPSQVIQADHIDEIVSAELPDPLEDPELSELVWTHNPQSLRSGI